VKDVNYFAAGGDASAAQIDLVLGDTELIVGKADPDQLAELVGKLTVAAKDADKVKGAFEEVAGKLEVGGLRFFKGQ
jgi:DnaJ family protein C protein 2